MKLQAFSGADIMYFMFRMNLIGLNPASSTEEGRYRS